MSVIVKAKSDFQRYWTEILRRCKKKNCIYICTETDMNAKYIKCNMYSNVNITSTVYRSLNEVFAYEEM